MMKTKTKLKLKNISKTATKTKSKKISQNENHTAFCASTQVINVRCSFLWTVLQPRRVDGRPVAVGPAHSVAGDVYSRPQAPPRAISHTRPTLPSVGHFKAVTLRSHYRLSSLNVWPRVLLLVFNSKNLVNGMGEKFFAILKTSMRSERFLLSSSVHRFSLSRRSMYVSFCIPGMSLVNVCWIHSNISLSLM